MKSIKAFMIVALLVALPALLASHAGAQTEPRLDHFKCWTVVEGRPANDFVLLHDQFNQAGELEPALVRSPIFFCNPTVKIPSTGVVTPILHPDNHLKMYLITTHPDPTTRTVTFSNQFTAAAGQTLTVFQPVILAVPTQKDPHAEPHGLNHFQCYLARGEPINAPVVLQDQFDKQRREVVKVLQPVLFCNPVEKQHDGVITPIIPPSTANDQDHLTCYVFTPSTTKTTGVRTRNQFGEERLLATGSRFLCVPSQKLRVQTP